MEENNIPEWKELLEERKCLLEKVGLLKKLLDNPKTKMNRNEWKMLDRQIDVMREYLNILTERCIYYNLIDNPFCKYSY